MASDEISAWQQLNDVMRRARALLALAGNDFVRSGWERPADALSEVDQTIAAIDQGTPPSLRNVSALFLPTGPIQEVSLSNGWAEEFLALADEFDAAERQITATQN